MRRLLALAFAASAVFVLGAGCVLDWDRGAGGSGGKSCTPGETNCEIDCDTSPCTASCGDATTCHVRCAGGGCSVACGTAALCELACAGGSCDEDCAGSSSCSLSCVGGGCTQACPQGVGCTCDGC
jgi:hypothetical protein